ncbi:hypothetical protein Pcinc_043218, partial [Petrolisthes cinctipes]
VLSLSFSSNWVMNEKYGDEREVREGGPDEREECCLNLLEEGGMKTRTAGEGEARGGREGRWKEGRERREEEHGHGGKERKMKEGEGGGGEGKEGED